MPFGKNISNNSDKNLNKNITEKYSQKPLDHANKSATDAIKRASKSQLEKPAEVTGNLIVNNTADKITEVSKSSLQNKVETKNLEDEDKYIYYKKKDSKLLMI